MLFIGFTWWAWIRHWPESFTCMISVSKLLNTVHYLEAIIYLNLYSVTQLSEVYILDQNDSLYWFRIGKQCGMRSRYAKKHGSIRFKPSLCIISAFCRVFLCNYMFVCLFVFYVPSTARSFRDGTPIYCPLRRMWSSVNAPFLPGIEPRAVAWQSITLLLRHASCNYMLMYSFSVNQQSSTTYLVDM